MKLLVACTACHRQFDASGIAAGSRFRCTCGVIVKVPETTGHEASVVRCSSCSGPRKGHASICGYCDAEFTLHDQDMQVVCSQCMARVSVKSKFCHHCGTPVAPEGDAGQPTEHNCPVCQPSCHLNSRRLGKQKMAVLECPACAGMWLGHEVFELLAERTRDTALPEGIIGTEKPNPLDQAGPMYRKCPRCRKAMNRTNFGKQSGVIIDRCKNHGTWFDPGELDGVLRWIKKGGEARTLRRQAEAAREAERRESLANYSGPTIAMPRQETRRSVGGEFLAATLIEVLFHAFDL